MRALIAVVIVVVLLVAWLWTRVPSAPATAPDGVWMAIQGPRTDEWR